MKICVDSCSIVLLSKASVLEVFASSNSIFIAEAVYKEILEGKGKKHIDALLIEKLVGEKKINLFQVQDTKLVNKLIEDFNLGVGEAETLALVKCNQCDIVSTDNKQGRKAAITYDLKLVGSLGAVTSLYKLKLIDKNKAFDALKKLREFGWFHDYLIDNAMEEIKNA